MTHEPRESAWAFKQLMAQAQKDIDAGTSAPAVVKFKAANPAKVCIGWFKRRLLRGEFRRRA